LRQAVQAKNLWSFTGLKQQVSGAKTRARLRKKIAFNICFRDLPRSILQIMPQYGG
jgi:hypothetical protein